ncbi:MAG TPA: hypothetical protein VF618_17315 [Thermoanaerobaculia bacterium]
MAPHPYLLARRPTLPVVVFTEAGTRASRCINGLHVQSFIGNPHGPGTMLTFVSGDVVLLEDDFDRVVAAFAHTEVEG